MRTYNFGENRVVDHRSGYKAYNLDAVLDGDLDAVVESLVRMRTDDALAEENGVSGPALVADLAAAVDRLQAAGVPTPRADAELLAAHAAGTDRGGLQRLVIMRAGWPDGRGRALRRCWCPSGPTGCRCSTSPGAPPSGASSSPWGRGCSCPARRPSCWPGSGGRGDGRPVPAGPRPSSVDLCTGLRARSPWPWSTRCPGARVGAVELDPHAHAWAARNVEALGRGRLELHVGDVARAARAAAVLRGPSATWSRPTRRTSPTTPSRSTPRSPSTTRAVALYGGPDGLRVLRVCVAQAARLLRAGGLLVMEHGEPQCDGVAAVLAAAGGWTDVAHHPDLTGRPRLTSARRA